MRSESFSAGSRRVNGGAQIFTTEDAAMTAFATARTVQCVAWWSGSSSVSATTVSLSDVANGAIPSGRVLSRSTPATPSAVNRSCQRHTQVFDLPIAVMIATLTILSSVSRTIRARWRTTRRLDCLLPCPVRCRDGNADPAAHPTSSHNRAAHEILSRTRPFRLIH